MPASPLTRPGDYFPREPIAEWLRQELSRGDSLWEIERRSGVPHGTLRSILTGSSSNAGHARKSQTPRRFVHYVTADRIAVAIGRHIWELEPDDAADASVAA